MALNVIKKLDLLLKRRNISQKELAAKLGCLESQVSNYMTGRFNFGWVNARKWGAALNVDPAWLKTQGAEGINPFDVEMEQPAPRVYNAPLVGKYGYAGFSNSWSDDDYTRSLPLYPFLLDEESPLPHGQYWAIEVKGDSMDDGSDRAIKDGDICLCREIAPHLYREAHLHFRKWFFAVVTTDGILIKQVTAHDLEAGTITLHSLNPLVEDRTIALADVKLIMNIVKVDRKIVP